MQRQLKLSCSMSGSLPLKLGLLSCYVSLISSQEISDPGCILVQLLLQCKEGLGGGLQWCALPNCVLIVRCMQQEGAAEMRQGSPL